MGLLTKLKSLLGIEKPTPERTGESSVAVEREPGGEDVSGADEDVSGADEVEEPVAEPTDAAGSTGSLVDEEAAASDPAEAAEPAEAAGPESEDVTTDIEETGPEPGSDGSESESPPVEEIKGIGPAYGERLGDVGVATVADLAAADPEDLAERTSVSESRLRTWIERAQEHGE